MGARSATEPIYEPVALTEYKTIKELGVLWRRGGLVDQPYISLAIYKAVGVEVRLHDSIQEANKGND